MSAFFSKIFDFFIEFLIISLERLFGMIYARYILLDQKKCNRKIITCEIQYRRKGWEKMYC